MVMKFTSLKIFIGCLICTVALTNCARPTMMQMTPAPVVENISVNNNTGYSWVLGAYHYQSGVYFWNRGSYEQLPKGRSSSIQGRHELVRGRYRDRNGYRQ